MNEKEGKTILFIEDTAENILTWTNKQFVPEELKIELQKSNVLIVPTEGFREVTTPVFPVGTEELFSFLKDNSSKGINPEICIKDAEYKELALHGALIIIGKFVLLEIIAPVFAVLISEYVLKRWPTKKQDNMKLELIIVKKNGDSKKLLYEGPVDKFIDTVKPALESITNNKHLPE